MVKNMKKFVVDQKWHLAQCTVLDSGQQRMSGKNTLAWKAQTDILQDFILGFQGFMYDRHLKRW